MDEAVYVLLADALAVGFEAAVGVDIVPPGAAFVMAEGSFWIFSKLCSTQKNTGSAVKKEIMELEAGNWASRSRN